jgi:hypothetical protein
MIPIFFKMAYVILADENESRECTAQQKPFFLGLTSLPSVLHAWQYSSHLVHSSDTGITNTKLSQLKVTLAHAVPRHFAGRTNKHLKKKHNLVATLIVQDEKKTHKIRWSDYRFDDRINRQPHKHENSVMSYCIRFSYMPSSVQNRIKLPEATS